MAEIINVNRYQHPAVVVAVIVCRVIEGWQSGRGVTFDDVIDATPCVSPHQIRKEWEKGLDASKFIAHSTGLKIPSPPPPPTSGAKAA